MADTATESSHLCRPQRVNLCRPEPPKASRQHLQEVGTNAIAVAMCSANNQEVISLDRSGEAKPDVPW